MVYEGQNVIFSSGTPRFTDPHGLKCRNVNRRLDLEPSVEEQNIPLAGQKNVKKAYSVCYDNVQMEAHRKHLVSNFFRIVEYYTAKQCQTDRRTVALNHHL